MIRSFLKDAGIIMLATSVANACNLLYQLYMVRNLNVQDFGILTSLLTAVFIFSVPCFALQTVVTKWSAQFHARAEEEKVRVFFWDLGKWVFITTFVFGLLGVLGTGQLNHFFRAGQDSRIVVTVFTVVLATLFPLWLGLLQGIQRFWVMGGLLVSVSAAKLMMGILFVEWGMSVDGALWSVFLSYVLTFPLAFWFCRRLVAPAYWPGWKWKLHETSDAFRYLVPSAGAFLCFTLLTQSDIILVKHFFPPLAAGIYATGSMVGKIILFLPLAVGFVLLPKASGRHARKQSSIGILKVSLGLAAVLCAVGALLAFVRPQIYVALFKVTHVDQFIPLARLFAVSMSFYALTQVIITYQLSVRNLTFIMPTFLLVCLQVGLIWRFHESLAQVLWILCILGLVVLSINLSRVRWRQTTAVTA